MADHPINGLIDSSMQSIKQMVDVNTIIGEPVETPDGTVIIPVSKVGFGFAAGGSDFAQRSGTSGSQLPSNPMFGGGSGAGVSIKPVAFLVVGQGQIKLLPAGENSSTMVDKLFEYVPQMVDKFNAMVAEKKDKKCCKKDKQDKEDDEQETAEE